MRQRRRARPGIRLYKMNVQKNKHRNGGNMSKIIVAYWSQTGNTEAMANAVGEGIKAAGGEADVVPVSADP